jgi:hypothetical protein
LIFTRVLIAISDNTWSDPGMSDPDMSDNTLFDPGTCMSDNTWSDLGQYGNTCLIQVCLITSGLIQVYQYGNTWSDLGISVW